MKDHRETLATIRATLAERKLVRETAARHERTVAAAQKHERELFARTVGVVAPLRRAATPTPSRPRPVAEARQRHRDEAAVLVEAMSDSFDAESLLDTDDGLSFRRRGVGIDVVRKLRRGVWVQQAEIDLHGLRRDQARERLVAFLGEAAAAGHRCVRVVHGKGLRSPGREPVLKGKVKSWLMQRREVIAFAYARPADGGHGALIVLLESATRRTTAR